jgi:predicted nucleic acid-binding protein
MSIYNSPVYFLDTNIWITYFITRKVGTLLDKLTPLSFITCTELLYEIKDVALRERITKKINPSDLNNYRHYIETQLLNIKQRADLHIDTPIPIIHKLPAADSKDWYIYNLSVMHPVIIVTKDTPLLQQAGLQCIEPAEFFKGL